MENADRNSDTNVNRRVRLIHYRKHDGRWQFFAVEKERKGEPNPGLIKSGGEKFSWKSAGAKFYLDWMDPVNGKRKRAIAETNPRGKTRPRGRVNGWGSTERALMITSPTRPQRMRTEPLRIRFGSTCSRSRCQPDQRFDQRRLCTVTCREDRHRSGITSHSD
jgi:hypothetical protein